MNYQETLNWMFAQLPMYQRQGKTALKKDLTNSIALSDRLGNPHKRFKSVHVAGTNGKGSTSHMLASVLMEAGYKVGLYTSPHLKDFRERIRVNGVKISEQEVIGFIAANRIFLEDNKVSFFEMTVGLAFDSFAKNEVDIAVVEVGLGGRLDSTNIIFPEVSVITNIGLDHTQFLGETLPEIAMEKGGIIKQNVPVVIGEYQDEVISVFQDIAKEKNADLFVASENIKGNFKTDLQGDYQFYNVRTAVQAIKVLQEKRFEISKDQLERGLMKVTENTGLLGRWHQLGDEPKIICDTAHNKEGLKYIFDQLKKETYSLMHIVLGVVNDKNLNEILPMFPKHAHYYFCRPDIPRGLPADDLKIQALEAGLDGETYNSVSEAFQDAKQRADSGDLIYVGGSTFVVAEVI